MNELRCGIFSSAKWVTRITGDAVIREPANIARRLSWAPDGPVRVVAVDLTWRLDGDTVHGPRHPSWWPFPRVELDFCYIDDVGGWIFPSADNDYWIEREILDFTSARSPDWVRRLVETRALDPVGKPAVLPPHRRPIVPVCIHDECPIHGKGESK